MVHVGVLLVSYIFITNKISRNQVYKMTDKSAIIGKVNGNSVCTYFVYLHNQSLLWRPKTL